MEATLPQEFYRTIHLEVGVNWADQRQTEIMVGPETVAARHAAMASRADWIDLDEISDAVLAANYDAVAASWKKSDGPLRPRPDLTDDQVARGLGMWEAWNEWVALHRVILFGNIPQPQVLEAVKKLVRGDVQAITLACGEVDAAVGKFRDENGAGDSGSGKSRDRGPAVPDESDDDL